MNGRDWVLYGANGYTGELIAEEAKRRGLTPILAGRREAAIRPLAERLGFPWRVVRLRSRRRCVAGSTAPRRCCSAPDRSPRTSAPFASRASPAAPTTSTSPARSTCSRPARRATRRRSKRGSWFCPVWGSTWCPSDCLALRLKEALPDANVLELAFFGTRSPSKGTAKTAVEGLALGGRVRRGGKVVTVPMAEERMRVPFTRRRARGGVGAVGRRVDGVLLDRDPQHHRVHRGAAPAHSISPAACGRRCGCRFCASSCSRASSGACPAPPRRSGAPADRTCGGASPIPQGRSRTGTLDGPEGYNLTVVTALECMRRVVAGEVPPGFTTPARAFGSGFIETFDGTTLRVD